MSTTIELITNYSVFNKNPWLIDFFKDSNLLGILQSFDAQYKDLEQAAHDFYTKIWIDEGEGNQLDVIGEHLVIDRDGRSDISYKTLLRTKAEINVGSGTPEQVIQAFKVIFNAENVEYRPEYPAKFWMWTDGNYNITTEDNLSANTGDNLVDDNGNNLILETPDESQLNFILKLIPAGVGLYMANGLIFHDGSYIGLQDGSDRMVGTTEVI